MTETRSSAGKFVLGLILGGILGWLLARAYYDYQYAYQLRTCESREYADGPSVRCYKVKGPVSEEAVEQENESANR